MQVSKAIAQRIKEVYFGGSWTTASVKEFLTGLSIKEANTILNDGNSIYTILHHCHYYTLVQRNVLLGKELLGSDKESFEVPPINSEGELNHFKTKVLEEANDFINLVHKLDDEILMQPFFAEKYGNYYRNLNGLIEHWNYHLGQLYYIRKYLISTNSSEK